MSKLGIILAGGQSRRMGENKALLQIQGKAVINTIVDSMSPVCEQLVISSGSRGLYEFMGLPVIADQYEGAGPLAGIHAALAYSKQEWNLVCSCDHPFASRLLFEGLIAAAERAPEEIDAVVPFYEGRIQPLVAVYRGRTLDQLDYCLKNDERRVKDWTSRLNVQQVTLEELVDVKASPMVNMALFNMNRPEDYQEALRLAAEHFDQMKLQ